MTETAPKTAKKLFQSASRDDTFDTCSQLYAAKYLWKIPDPGNDGAHRGSTCHDALELLLKPRHKRHCEAALKARTCKASAGLWRLLVRYAKKYHVFDDANLKMIDAFMLVALGYEFHGPAGTFEAIAEREFSLDVDEPDGRRYRIRGFIDQTFKVKDDEGIILFIKDFKGSKAKFSGEKATFNAQSIIYQLAAQKLHPEITRRRFRFLFMKFPRQPWQEQDAMTDEQLYGYEWVLTDMQQRMESFTLANQGDNLVKDDPESGWLCGREGFKADGSPAWICSARRPLDYFTIVDAAGEAVTSGFTEEELIPKLKPGQAIEPRSYPGCCAYYGAAVRGTGLS